MIYEFRLYTAIPGRLTDIAARFTQALPPLFARHGIANIGRWQSVGGARGPLWIYALRYADLAERERVWASFYADDDWWQVRAATNAGEEMVDRFDLHLLQANRLDPAAGDFLGGQFHELLFIEQPLGRTGESLSFLEQVYLPLLEAAGARRMMAADFVTGPSLPRTALLLAWPDAAAGRSGHLGVANHPDVATAFRSHRAQYGRSLLGAIDAYAVVAVPCETAKPSLHNMLKEEALPIIPVQTLAPEVRA